MRFRCRLIFCHKRICRALLATAALAAATATAEESNFLLLRVVLDGEEIAAAIDGEERDGAVYVNLAELADALEEPPKPPLMAAVSRLGNYFSAGFFVDLREQALYITGRGETAIERRLQAEYDEARRRPPPEEYEVLAAPAYQWFAPPFASFSHQVRRSNADEDIHNSVLLFGDFLKSDGYFSAWDGGVNSSGGASLDLRRDGGRIFISRDFDSRRTRFTAQSAERALADDSIFWRLGGNASNAGLRQGNARMRGIWENSGWGGGWNSGVSLSNGGGSSVFGGMSIRPPPDENSRRSGLSLRVFGDYNFQTATQRSRRSRIAVRFSDRIRRFSLSAESRHYDERESEQKIEINQQFRTVERPRLHLRLRADADFGGDRERKSRADATLYRRFFVGEDRKNRIRAQWRAGYGHSFAPDSAADFFTLSLGASKDDLSGTAEWRHDFRDGRNRLGILLSGGKRIGWSVDGFATDNGEWGAGLSFHHTWAFDPVAGRLRFSNRLAGQGAISVCANTAAGEAVPEVRLRGRDRDIRLDEENGCAFIPASGARRVALDKKSLPPGVKADRGGVIAEARRGRVTEVNFLLVVSGEVEGVLRANGAPIPGLAVELIHRATEETTTVRTVFDGSFSFFDVAPGDYLLRAHNTEREITVGEEEVVRVDLNLD